MRCSSRVEGTQRGAGTEGVAVDAAEAASVGSGDDGGILGFSPAAPRGVVSGARNVGGRVCVDECGWLKSRRDQDHAGSDEAHADFRRTEELAQGYDRQLARESKRRAEPDRHRGPDWRRCARDDWRQARRAGQQAPSAARRVSGRQQDPHRRRKAVDAVSRGAEAVAAP